MKQSTSFDIGTLQYACDNHILKQIALFYLIKAKYSHSIIYNYNPFNLSKRVGLHHKTVERYVNRLIKEGFCELRDNHLLFKNIKKVLNKEFRKSKTLLPTRPYTSFHEILNRIYYVLLLNNKEQQKFKIVTHYGKYIGHLNPKLKRKAIKQANLKEGLENSAKPIISISGASRLFNLSKTTSAKALTGLKKKKYLKFNTVINHIGKSLNTKYCSGLGYFFNKRGCLYQYLGREIQTGSYIYSMT